MKLYHYLKANYAYAALQKERLKVAIMNSLNDPFEFRSVILPSPRWQTAAEKTIEIMSKSRGLICFSEIHTNPVQWAHYAESHTGVCLAFEIEDHLLLKIKYEEVRPNHIDLNSHGLLPDSIKNKMLTTKFKDWSYEQERRMVPKLNDSTDGIYYEPFSEIGKLKEIILGIRFRDNQHSISLDDIVGSYSAERHRPTISQAILCEKEFKIRTEPVVPYNSDHPLHD